MNNKKIHYLIYTLIGLLFISCTMKENKTLPKAKKITKKLTTHQHERVDPYYWMRLSDD